MGLQFRERKAKVIPKQWEWNRSIMWIAYDSKLNVDVPGTVGLVPLQLNVGISPSSNGRERMDVNGIVGLVVMQLVARSLCHPMDERDDKILKNCPWILEHDTLQQYSLFQCALKGFLHSQFGRSNTEERTHYLENQTRFFCIDKPLANLYIP